MGLFTDSNRDLKEQARIDAQRQQEAIERDRREREEAQRRAQEQEQQRVAQEAAQRAERAQRRQTFLTNASGYAGEKMRATGLNDTYGLGAYYQNLLNTRASALGDDADLATAIDPESLYATAYNDVREGARRKEVGRVNEFAGTDYGRTQFADTADDAILDAILGTQYGNARGAVDRAKSRGQLNEAGYTAAGSDLETTRGTARTKLEDTGLGVLNRYRDDLNTRVEDVRGRARNLDLGENLDISGMTTGIGQAAEGYRNRMEGDVRTAVGGTDFFDIANLLGRASSNQGFNNPGRTAGNPLAAAFSAKQNTPDDREAGRNRRTMANVGAF